MKTKVFLVGAALALATVGGGACSPGATTTTATTVTSTPPSSLAATTTTGSPTSSTTTAPGPVLAGQPGATTASALGFQAGYQETAPESAGHQLLHRYQPARDTPGTQVHCPAVVAAVGTTLVCRVDTNATSFIDEPLKVDGINPLNIEFAVVDPASFVCSAHATWVVQAMAKVGVSCSTSATTGQGQGGQGGQGGQ